MTKIIMQLESRYCNIWRSRWCTWWFKSKRF